MFTDNPVNKEKQFIIYPEIAVIYLENSFSEFWRYMTAYENDELSTFEEKCDFLRPIYHSLLDALTKFHIFDFPAFENTSLFINKQCVNI